MKKFTLLMIFISNFNCKFHYDSGTDPNIGYPLISITEINILYKIVSLFQENELKKMEKEIVLKEGFGSKILKENAYIFYQKYWETKKEYYKNSEYNYPIAVNILNSLRNNISIVYMSEKYAILSKPSDNGDELDSIRNTDDIWLFEKNTWKPFLEYTNTFHKSKVIDLNNDGFNDVVLTGSIIDSETYNIFISEKNGNLKYVQEIITFGEPIFTLKENCQSELIVKYFEDTSIYKKMSFDCKKNLFVLN
ncbi:FG-GAP repeat domain-containing protein [Leptospira kanakyensis]|nr:VCBS repeat-containing protein [Leptospira kanakyensis]MCW7482569.1 VCBS repeat-containing protein [Leptospira kanakyensis]